jgi:hypothetical protein
VNKEIHNFLESNKRFAWRPGPPIPQDIWTSDWPWVPYDKKLDPYSVYSELQSIDHLFVDHREDDKIETYGHKGWSAVCMHGIDWDKTQAYHQYGYKSEADVNYQWTSICDKIPYITNLVKSFEFDQLKRIRIMRLAPGGYIMPHVDGKGRIFGPFNFALTHPLGCNFVFEKYGIVPFKVGRGFMLDLGVKHCIVNDSDEVRYHLIIHGNPLHPMMQKVVDTVKSMRHEHSN